MSEEKVLSSAMKYWIRNKENPYACPDCSRITNKSTYKQHNQTQCHRLAVLTKQSENTIKNDLQLV
mgnify:CR=1 FL=1